MKKSIITILPVLAFIGGFLIFYNLKTVSSPTQNNSDVLNALQKWESKIDDQALVTVTVTPVDISSRSKEWRFDVVMDTHSVELDQDMTKIAILIDEQGKEYQPLAWEGPTGGHHREGVLTFARITPTPKSIELKITNIGGVPSRSFAWNLQ